VVREQAVDRAREHRRVIKHGRESECQPGLSQGGGELQGGGGDLTDSDIY